MLIIPNIAQCPKSLCFAMALLTWLVASMCSTASAAWSVISLHPPGATSSLAYGIRSGQQVGRADGNAVRWAGTVASVVSLGPQYAGNTDGVQQVGFRGNGAALWTGSAGSYVDLSPPGIPGYLSSIAAGVFDGMQCGYVYFQRSTVLVHAGFWNDTASSWVDLNPPGAFTVSAAEGVHFGQQVGFVWYENQPFGHAVVWYNSAASVVDLNPAGAEQSYGYGVFNGKQVGWARMSGETFRRASLWSSMAASWVNLHPTQATASEGAAVYFNQQTGFAVVGGQNRASFWNSTPVSWINLHSFLPPGYTWSQGVGIWTSNGGVTYVSGYAVNTNTGQAEAMLWSNPNPTAPCPGNINGDGGVNVDDLLTVINGWGPCRLPPAPCLGDIAPPPSGNGFVNVDDLLAVLNSWGPCP